MYLLDIALLVRQLLPPHWRYTVRNKIIDALIAPIKDMYDRFLRYRDETHREIVINAQVGVLDDVIKQLDGDKDAGVYDANNGTYTVSVKASNRNEATKILERYRIAGTTYTFNDLS